MIKRCFPLSCALSKILKMDYTDGELCMCVVNALLLLPVSNRTVLHASIQILSLFSSIAEPHVGARLSAIPSTATRVPRQPWHTHLRHPLVDIQILRRILIRRRRWLSRQRSMSAPLRDRGFRVWWLRERVRQCPRAWRQNRSLSLVCCGLLRLGV